MRYNVENHGFTVISAVLAPNEERELLSILGPVSGAGRRGLLNQPAIRALARSSRLLDLVRPHLASEPFPVRTIYFDKSPETNWLVPWHQDLTITVREKAEVAGFGPWSTKDGIPHVQPPVELLEQMLSLRLHFDDADESNGALRIIPGSHRMGRLSAPRIRALRSEQPEHLCTASAGNVLLMRPLVLHASSRSTAPRHRRVLHIEYSGVALPSALQWHDAA